MRSTSVALLALALAVAVVASAASGVGLPAAVQADGQTEPPVEQWNRTYDSPGNEIFSSITTTPDGYLLTGWTERDGSDDGWVIAVDSEGRERWSTVVGGNGTDRLYGAVRTSDGGYLLAGRTDEDDQARGWLVKVDDGTVEWQRTVASRPGAFWAIARNETGVLLGGWTWQDGSVGWLVTVDERGDVLRERTYRSDGDAKTYVKSLVVGEDGVLLAGTSKSEDGQDGWAARVADNGTVEWNRTYGTADHGDVWAAAADGSGYVLAGEAGTAERPGRDAWIVALDSDGSVRWERTLGGEGHDWFDSATATDDELLFTGGTATGGIGGADGFVVATDRDGTERWRTVLGTPKWDKPWPAVATDDGGYLLAGHTAGYDTNGTGGWVVRLSHPDEPTETTTSEPTTDATSTDREATEDNATIGPLWRPRLTALVALAALALGALVARR